jgi:Tfp pilus assembly protein PilE
MPIQGRYLACGASYPKEFSLIKVMIVVAIICILVTLAYPRLEASPQRAQQSEVKTNLAAIHTAEKLHHASNGAYIDNFSALEARIAGDAIYNHDITTHQYPHRHGNCQPG